MMKKKNSWIENLILALLALVILLPILTLLIWTFTERWAWPDLIPQVFSARALREILRQKESLTKIFVSSILISTVVAVLSATIGLMTASHRPYFQMPSSEH